MKHLSVLMMAGFLLAGQAMAEPPSRRGDPEKRLAHMQQELGLSDAQVQQIRENHANGGGREGMRAILTESQREQLHEMHRKRKGNGKGKNGGRPESTDESS